MSRAAKPKSWTVRKQCPVDKAFPLWNHSTCAASVDSGIFRVNAEDVEGHIVEIECRTESVAGADGLAVDQPVDSHRRISDRNQPIEDVSTILWILFLCNCSPLLKSSLMSYWTSLLCRWGPFLVIPREKMIAIQFDPIDTHSFFFFFFFFYSLFNFIKRDWKAFRDGCFWKWATSPRITRKPSGFLTLKKIPVGSWDSWRVNNFQLRPTKRLTLILLLLAAYCYFLHLKNGWKKSYLKCCCGYLTVSICKNNL